MTKRLWVVAAGIIAVACGVVTGDDEMMSAKPDAKPAVAKAAPAEVALTPQQSQFFETRIRPLLTANCYKCHSAEQGKAKGGLTLDTREGWKKGGDTGTAIVAGDPGNSLLIKAISYADEDLQMPPKGEKLSDKEIADLTAWVKMGAPDPRVAAPGGPKLTGLTDKAKSHWAFQPVKKPDVPQVSNQGWVKTPVDAFVLAKLDQNGMRPSAPAAKEALIRRATFDLIGLPPTPEQVRAFVADASANAFEKVVDRLLASSQYGERWGRYWLDSARYSDTSGAENNNRREDYRYAFAWTYRDYVIKSFNEDKPYDQFLVEQIAADKLPEAKEDPSKLAALGFLTVGKRFPNVNDQIDERIDTLTKSTMALTVACARCHDHKFDPIPTADYYSLHGVFVSTVEPAEKPLIGPAPDGAEYADFTRKVKEIEEKNREVYYNYVETKAAEFRSKAAAYIQVGMNFRRNDQQAILARNKLIQEHKLDRDMYSRLRINGREDALFGPLMKFAEIPADQFEAKAKDVLDQIARGRLQRRPINRLVVEAFKKAEPASLKSMADVANVYAELFKSVEPQFKEYLKANRTAKTADAVTGYDRALVEVMNYPAEVEPAAVLDTERLKLAAARLPQQNNNAYQRFRFNEINELQLTHPGSPARAMVVADGQVRNSPIFIRGEAQNRGAIVPRRFLEVLSGPNRQAFKDGSGRLELARAIASKDNPLTARVAVNRIWMHHFGDGFVRTPDDMGVMSEAPSHPELIDYLAARFVEDGWSFKRMHKLIMLSSAYQQSSDTNLTFAQKDPDNRLLWRANLRRLDFEAIRDSMLQFTGKLDLSLGGQPVNLTDEPYSFRRSVYGYIDRGNMPELMQQFDFSDPDMANTKRTTTIVPQQALFFMNSPMSVDVARKVTSRPEFTAAKDDPARVRAVYQVLFARAPRPEEVKAAMDFVRAKREPVGVQIASTGSPREAIAKERAARAATKRAEQRAKAQQNRRQDGKRAIQNEGEVVDRRPLTVWEEYAQALLFTNEIAYVN